jgi:hypothetical protein
MTQSSERPPNLWPSLESRVRKLVREELRGSRDGVAIVYINMWVDSDGDPIHWERPIVRRLEPSSTALDDVMKYIAKRMRER